MLNIALDNHYSSVFVYTNQSEPFNIISMFEFERDQYIQQHIDKLGKKPNIIGMHWNNDDELIAGLIKAVETNTPYDERLLLDEDSRKAWDEGDLVF